ncbi:MAG: formylglycine-generating enzyme family protein [Candidatus Sumerlaeota bacterium]|nr:formylglycine-generating enzyme family protein [Candidatus Sumerlaeota bacterium]
MSRRGVRGAILSAFMAFAFVSLGYSQSPAVSNVVASQRAGGAGIVDIYYDLSGWDGPATVSVLLSVDNGATWSAAPRSAFLTGDVGPGIVNGTSKHIVWDAGSDQPGLYSTNARIKVIANGPGGSSESVLSLPGGVPMEVVLIPAGVFVMGSTDRGGFDNEKPPHAVTLSGNFWIGKCEVTQKQWTAVMGSNPASGYGVGDNYPVYDVSWDMIAGPGGFFEKMNQYLQATGQIGNPARLPTEAEWECACRGGTQTRFYFGDSLSVGDNFEDGPAGLLPGNRTDYMWYGANNTGTAHPVGQKLPNQFGLFDMSGNLWEWCQDYWHDSYTGAPADGSAWLNPTSGSRVVRSGCWNNDALASRSAFRYSQPSDFVHCRYGFRVARAQD